MGYVCLDVEELSQETYPILLNIAACFPRWPYQLLLPAAVYGRSSCSESLSARSVVQHLNLCQSNECEMVSQPGSSQECSRPFNKANLIQVTGQLTAQLRSRLVIQYPP